MFWPENSAGGGEGEGVAAEAEDGVAARLGDPVQVVVEGILDIAQRVAVGDAVDAGEMV